MNLFTKQRKCMRSEDNFVDIPDLVILVIGIEN